MQYKSFIPLADMRRDPGERIDIISQHPEIADKLDSIAQIYHLELGDDLTGYKGTHRQEPCYR